MRVCKQKDLVYACFYKVNKLFKANKLFKVNKLFKANKLFVPLSLSIHYILSLSSSNEATTNLISCVTIQ